MGNPAARVKLVEYGSLTCGHCANFSNSAKGALAARVRNRQGQLRIPQLCVERDRRGCLPGGACGGTRASSAPESFYARKRHGRQDQRLPRAAAAAQGFPRAAPVRIAELAG
jgi:hypothetical protein